MGGRSVSWCVLLEQALAQVGNVFHQPWRAFQVPIRAARHRVAEIGHQRQHVAPDVIAVMWACQQRIRLEGMAEIDQPGRRLPGLAREAASGQEFVECRIDSIQTQRAELLGDKQMVVSVDGLTPRCIRIQCSKAVTMSGRGGGAVASMMTIPCWVRRNSVSSFAPRQ